MRRNRKAMFVAYEKGIDRIVSMLSDKTFKRYTRKQLTGGNFPEEGISRLAENGFLEKNGQCMYRKTPLLGTLSAIVLYNLMYSNRAEIQQEHKNHVPNSIDLEICASICVLFKKINGREPYMDEVVAIYSIIKLESKAA